MAVGIYNNAYASSNRCPTDPGDKCVRVRSSRADPNGVGFASTAGVADVDIVIPYGEAGTRIST